MTQTFYQSFMLPLLKKVDPEKSHDLTVSLLHALESSSCCLRLLEKLCGNTTSLSQDPRLHIAFNGLNFNSPLMVAAGWDKQGLCAKALHAMGFSTVEIGSVTLEPQTGNPKPRIFRIAPGVVINHCGFNSLGATAVSIHLKRYQNRNFPLGISLGKNASVSPSQSPAHFRTLAQQLHSSGDYCVINVSSPNTPGLRDLQNRSELTDIIQAIDCGSKPLFIKISPDLHLNALDQIIDVALCYKLSGIIAVNTLLDPTVKTQYGAQAIKGGLSGNNTTYRDRATHFCRHIYQNSSGQLTVIASGGVYNAYTALEKITAGASMVQIMSALAEQGPGIANRIKKDLIAFMEHNKIEHILNCRGQDQYLKAFK